jgi:hypothetical protein
VLVGEAWSGDTQINNNNGPGSSGGVYGDVPLGGDNPEEQWGCEVFVQATDWWTCVSSGGITNCRITETTYEITYENCGSSSGMSSSDDDALCQPKDDNIPIIEPDLELWGEMMEDLNPCEVAIAIQFPVEAIRIYKNKEIAETFTVSIFGFNGLNDCSDAFRHAFFNAINTRDTNPSVTLLLSSAHECGTPEDRIREQEMDLFNNKVGIDVGKNNANYNDTEMANAVVSKLLEGKLRTLSNLGVSNKPTGSTQLISSSICN